MHHDLEDSRKHGSASFSFSRKTYILQDRRVDREAFEIHRGSSFNENQGIDEQICFLVHYK